MRDRSRGGFIGWIGLSQKLFLALALTVVTAGASGVLAQHSVARLWNEALLQSIRKDFARPPIHARNLFHVSAAMYDAWAAYDNLAEPYLLGKTIRGYTCRFDGINAPADVNAARAEAISYAAYRLIKHRFKNSPGAARTLPQLDSLLAAQGYEVSNASTNYQSGSPAALGNYIAQSFIDFGLQDGCNEAGNYAYQYYQPFNTPLIPVLPGNPTCIDPNRWQPLTLEIFIDQAGNVIPGNTPKFIGPEWGQVSPFALEQNDLTVYQRDGFSYCVYHDPGAPPYLDTLNASQGLADDYKWSFSLVSIWQSHLDPSDGVTWDISPASIGNVRSLPKTPAEHKNFYNLLDGGDAGRGYAVNPRTGQPYAPQIVPRGDYARALAEFWADGPNSETPPGHWFTILNYVSDHPLLQKRFNGQGPILDDLEWDVKTYFILGGAMHDAAIMAWGVKGWYDYVRPISAIRYMADHGQSSDTNLPRYSPAGIPLVDGFIELVESGDPLAGANNENAGKIKLFTWRGHEYVNDPAIDVAGVGWILAERWWPYQRPTFVTPPFAGYISGHSTYSRTAAEIMTTITGDEFFPGGLGEFHCAKNEFLVFEEGPSVDLTMQWATYRDASDQCSLSRIWGGIHPPIDDIPGRIAGQVMAADAFQLGKNYFEGQIADTPTPATIPISFAYPNPVLAGNTLKVRLNQPASDVVVKLYNITGQLVQQQSAQFGRHQQQIAMNTNSIAAGIYFLRLTGTNWAASHKILILK